MNTRILLPLDGSRISERAVAAVADFCRSKERCSVEVFRVIDPMAAWGALHLLYEEDEATRYVQEQAAALSGQGVEASSSIEFGSPARQILKRLRSGEFDYVCMATHGRSGIARAALGSVTDQVMRHSPVPMLVVHPSRVAKQTRRVSVA